uniref:mRNA (guanine-N(7))-methyltransferase n=1 Tax=viral metagenome TaxID=1070528 RepID=A0A6C0AKI6_9ZZZZ
MESLLSTSARKDLDHLASFVKHSNAELECKVLSNQIQTKDVADRIIKRIESLAAGPPVDVSRATFSYPDNIRVIVEGAQNIHKVCQTNSFKGTPLKVERKQPYFSGSQNERVDVPEAGIYFTLRKEEEVRRDFTGAAMDAKSYLRILNRRSWKTQDGLLQIDMSMVKTKLRGMRSISEVLRQTPTYELEIEVINRKADPSLIVESMINHISILLTAFHGSAFLLPASDVKRYDMEFRTTGHKFFNPVTMKRRHIRADRPNNILTGYTVTTKADGERCFLVVMRDKRMIMVRPNGTITWTGMTTTKDVHVNDVVDGEFIEDKNLFCIFDVYSFRGANTTRLPLMTTDTDVEANPLKSRLGCAREFVSDLRRDFVTQMTSRPLRVETKLFLAGDGPAMEEAINTMLSTRFEYETDGLVFTPRASPVANLPDRRGNTWTTVYKWKPPTQNSIDFLVKFKPGDDYDVVLKKAVFHGQLYISRTRGFDIVYPCETMTGEYTPPKMAPELQNIAETRDRVPGIFQPSVPRNPDAYKIAIPLDAKGVPVDKAGGRVDDNTIIECVRNMETDRWEILRTRHDKTQQYRVLHQPQFGNDVAVANSIWTNIHVPVTEEMLTTCVSNPPDDTFEDDLYYRDDLGSRDRVLKDTYAFHNKIKASLFSQNVKPGTTLLELAMGRAGDLLKWKECRPSRVVGIDVAAGNLDSPVQGACVRYVREKAQDSRIPPALFLVGDMTKPLYEQDNRYIRILAGLEQAPTPYLQQFAGLVHFDAISCQMALHYACVSEDVFKVFLKNLIDHGKGLFFGTCMDGAAVYAALMGKKSNLFRADGQVFGEISKSYDDGESWKEEFGQMISVKLESFERAMEEALVPFGKVTEMLAEAGYELVNTEMFSEYYTKQTNITLSQEHQAFSFLHRSFVFKRGAPVVKEPEPEPEPPKDAVQNVDVPVLEAPVEEKKPKVVRKKLIKAPKEEEAPAAQPPVLFYGADESKGEYRFMSNMFVAPFEVDGMKFPTVEHYFQWSKAMMFEGKESEHAVKMMKPPRNKEYTEAKSVKALGRKVKDFSPARWDDVKIGIMEKAVRAKFVNPEHGLLEKLLATGDREIGEANPRDKYWGIGTSADTADAKNPKKWKGQNQLGKILMKLREEFTEAKKGEDKAAPA